MCFTMPVLNFRVRVRVSGATGKSPRLRVHCGNVAKTPSPYAYDLVRYIIGDLLFTMVSSFVASVVDTVVDIDSVVDVDSVVDDVGSVGAIVDIGTFGKCLER